MTTFDLHEPDAFPGRTLNGRAFRLGLARARGDLRIVTIPGLIEVPPGTPDRQIAAEVGAGRLQLEAALDAQMGWTRLTEIVIASNVGAEGAALLAASVGQFDQERPPLAVRIYEQTTIDAMLAALERYPASVVIVAAALGDLLGARAALS